MEDEDWEDALVDIEIQATEYVAHLTEKGIKIRGGIRISKTWQLKRKLKSNAVEEENQKVKKIKIEKEDVKYKPDVHINTKIKASQSSSNQEKLRKKMKIEKGDTINDFSKREHEININTKVEATQSSINSKKLRKRRCNQNPVENDQKLKKSKFGSFDFEELNIVCDQIDSNENTA